MIVIKEYLETDPSKKDIHWAQKLITDFRRYMQPLVDPAMAESNMQYLLNTESDEPIRKMFKNQGKNSNLSFISVAVVEKYRNILIAEREKAGISIGLQTIDASVVDAERKKDLYMLRYKKATEAAITTLHQKIGRPPFVLDKSYFSGNINEFEDMGLDSEDDENLNYFFATHWRLLQEVFGEIPLQAIVKHNKLNSKIPMWCNDILAKKAIASQIYVNQVSGELKVKYVAPENIRLIPGESKDFQDAPAIEVAKSVSVAQLIQELGNEFDPVTDYQFLVSAINIHHVKSFTGLYDNQNNSLWIDPQSSNDPQGKGALMYSEFLGYKLPLHYIEWKTTDSTYTKEGKSVHGNPKFFYVEGKTEVHSDFYQKVTYNNEVTYRAHYIPISGLTQRIFRFGKLFHQTIEGAEDEYSNYSICCFKEVGPTAIDVMKPCINMIKKSWTKFEWMVQKAKPSGRTYNYEALVQIASNMIKEGTQGAKVSALIKQFEEGINDIYTIPTVGGERVGGGGNPYFEKKNGLDATAKDFLEVISWASAKMASDLGVNDIMAGENPSQNDGYKIGMEALKNSRNATEYISTMLLRMFEHTGSQILLTVQDIIKFKTSNAYRFIEKLVGEDTIKGIEATKVAFHRMGTYIDCFNRDFERAEIKELSKAAYINKEIDLSQYLLVNSIMSPSKAAMTLAYEKRRQEKIKDQQLQVAHENAMALEKQRHDNKMEQITTEGQLDIKGKEVEGQFYLAAAKATADGGIEKKRMEIEAIDDKNDSKANADIKKQREKTALQNESVLG